MKILIVALALILVALFSWALVASLHHWLLRFDVVDHANERSLHSGVVPRGGGLVIVLNLLLALWVAAYFDARSQTFLIVSLLMMLWAGLSVWDDKSNLSPQLRFILQLVITILSLLALGWVTEIRWGATTVLYLGWAGFVVSALGMLWLSNLYNFMDGLDGLAASQSIVAALTLAIWFWLAGDLWMALVCVVVAASSYGFLLHNWHPARIFLGDVGSVSLGALFATLIIYANTRYQIPIVCSVILFSVFVADATLTLCRRVIKAEKIWQAHRSHFYQRAAGIGINHAHIAVFAAILMIICSLLASWAVAEHDRIPLVILLSLAVVILPGLWVSWMEKTKQT